VGEATYFRSVKEIPVHAAGTRAYSMELLQPIGVILLRRLADYQDKTKDDDAQMQ